MKVLNNFNIQHKCTDCTLRSEGYFCKLSQSALQAFESRKITSAYPKGTTLFIEGQPSNGVFMLCQGRVKLSSCSRDGRIIILRIAEAGEVLGLSATVSDSEYQATAEVLEPCQVNFVRKNDFMQFLEQNPEASMSAVRQLSYNYHTANNQIFSLGLSNSVSDKLAKLFLSWCETNGKSNGNGKGNGNGHIHLKISYTHEEIAEMIGASRETVTRLLRVFREKNLITLKGSDLVVLDKKQLETTVNLR